MRTSPRWLEVDLGRLERGAERAVTRAAPRFDAPWLARLAAASGAAAGLARLAVAPADDVPFVVAVGDAVRRGLPTAARASLVARSPLTGRPAEGQVGSDLGRRLARTLDVLVLVGRARRPGAVLVVGRDGALELFSDPDLRGLSADETHARLVARLGPCATLRVGPAGEAGAPVAHLAAGSDPPSRVGRGGLGAAFAARGLKALAVLAEPVESAPDAALVESLLASPRLAARAADGTFELAAAQDARGDSRGRGQREPSAGAGSGTGREVLAGARGAARDRHGCKGCPTPCGWTFETPGGEPRAARFSAHQALGVDLGFDGFDEGARLLARCDALGVDAKEVGAGLALLARGRELGRPAAGAGPQAWGRREVFDAWLDQLAAGVGEGAVLGRGAAAVARALGLEAEHFAAAGESTRADGELAARLGTCVAARGAEPMRTFPFLVGVDRARLARQVAPLDAPPGIEDPRSPTGKGRLVWWHENLAAALDVTGFCAFSAAGLLADGVCELEELAARVLPAGHAEGGAAAALLALGEATVGLHHELARAWGVAPPGVPEWARESLARPGMLDEYLALRGAGPGRPPGPAADQRWTRFEGGPPAEFLAAPGGRAPAVDAAADAAAAEAPTASGPGRVVLVAGGALADRLGAREVPLELALPAPLRDVLAAAAVLHPRAAGWLLGGGREPLPVVWRAGVRLDGAASVSAGDRLDLVLAVSGG